MSKAKGILISLFQTDKNYEKQVNGNTNGTVNSYLGKGPPAKDPRKTDNVFCLVYKFLCLKKAKFGQQ